MPSLVASSCYFFFACCYCCLNALVIFSSIDQTTFLFFHISLVAFTGRENKKNYTRRANKIFFDCIHESICSWKNINKKMLILQLMTRKSMLRKYIDESWGICSGVVCRQHGEKPPWIINRVVVKCITFECRPSPWKMNVLQTHLFRMCKIWEKTCMVSV